MTDERQGAPPPATPLSAPPASAEQAAQHSRPRHPDRACLNCGNTAFGDYCPQCGQQKVDLQVSVSSMVRELLEDELLLGRRLPLTLMPLLFRPGFLTDEVLKGRIVRYVLPFRLYLMSSVVCFLLLSFVSISALEEQSSAAGPTVELSSGDGGERDLAQLDSAIAALDEQLANPDINAAAAIGIRTARAALVRERAEDALAAAADTVPPGPTASAVTGAAGDSADADPGSDEDPTGPGWMTIGNVSTGWARADSAIVKRLRRWNEMPRKQAEIDMVDTGFRYVPTIIFLLVPVFAGILKLLYIRHKRFYAEHMIFALHTHAFIFVVFTLMILLRHWIGGWPFVLLSFWVFAYVYLAMRRVYGQSHVKTFIKYWTLGWTYFWVLLIGVPVLFILSILIIPA
jgi:hypothetical protein